MIKESNCRLQITISKEQKKWLEKQCKKLKITESQYIKWILSRKAQEIAEYLYMQTDESQEYLKEIIEIVKTPWLKKEN